MPNSKEFIKKSFDVDMSNQYHLFEKYLKQGAVILDVNFGSGRDSLYFQKQGYEVYSIDENKEFIEHGIEIGLKNVSKTSLSEIEYIDQFDGIWCPLSFSDTITIKKVLWLFSRALKDESVLLLSFEMEKYKSHGPIVSYVAKQLERTSLRIECFSIVNDERDGELKQWVDIILIKRNQLRFTLDPTAIEKKRENQGTLEEREIPQALLHEEEKERYYEQRSRSMRHLRGKGGKDRCVLKRHIIKRSRIYYSLVAEKSIKRNTNFIVNFLMCTRDSLDILDMLKERFDHPQTQTEESAHKVKKGNQVTVLLTSPNIPSLKDEESFIWDGKYHVCSLSGFLPNDYAPNNLLLNVDILVNGIRVSRLKTIVDLNNNRPGELVFAKEDVRKIFFSYSSQDRRTVLSIAKKIDKMYNHNIDFFLDVLSLRVGDKWKERIYQEIDGADTFCLVWSKNAYQSEWVDKEWRYAFETKGIEAFAPINLDAGNNQVPIPKELEDIHFGCYPLIVE